MSKISSEQSKLLMMNNRRKQVVLWAGVLSFTALIFVLWFVNARAMLYDVKHTKSVDGKILNDASKDFATVLKSLSDSDTLTPEVKAIEERDQSLSALKEAFAKVFTETDSASSTEIVTTSSTTVVTTSTEATSVTTTTVTTTPKAPEKFPTAAATKNK